MAIDEEMRATIARAVAGRRLAGARSIPMTLWHTGSAVSNTPDISPSGSWRKMWRNFSNRALHSVSSGPKAASVATFNCWTERKP